MELNVKQLSLEKFNVKGFRKFGQHHFHQSSNHSKLYYHHIRDMGSFSKMTPPTKEQREKEEKPLMKQQEKQEKQLDAGTKAEAETTCTAGGATEQNTEEEASADDKVPGKLLGKRAGKPTPTRMEHDLKKKKLDESKIQDQDKARPSKGEGKASKKEEQEQKQEVFNVPQTRTRTNDGPAPTTPEGRQQPPPINPIYTPARPKSKSRLIKDEPLLKDSTKLD